MYVIKHLPTPSDPYKGYVARPGSHKSYVKDISKAQRYGTIDAAMRECCGNEKPVKVY